LTVTCFFVVKHVRSLGLRTDIYNYFGYETIAFVFDIISKAWPEMNRFCLTHAENHLYSCLIIKQSLQNKVNKTMLIKQCLLTRQSTSGWYVSFKKIYIPCMSGLPSLYSVFKGQKNNYT